MANRKMLTGIDVNSNKLTGLPAPTADSDAATKKYVDDNIGSPDAANVTFTPEAGTYITPPATTTAVDNVDEALKWLFQFANDGKTNIADVIGSPAASSDTFAELKAYIQDAKNKLATLINRAEGTATVTGDTATDDALETLTGKLPEIRAFKKKVKFLKQAGDTETLTFKPYNGAPPTLENLCFTVFVRTNDAPTSQTVASFNNGDESNFSTNNFVEFTAGGLAQLKSSYQVPFVESTELDGVSEATFDISAFQDLNGLTIDASTTLLSFTARPFPQVLIPTGDIPIPTNTVLEISSITQVSSAVGAGSAVKFAISFDSGVRWYGRSGSTWSQINETSNVLTANELSAGGMTNTTVNNLSMVQIEQLRRLAGNNPATVKFAYYLQDDSIANKSSIDSVSLNVVMSGVFRLQGRGSATVNDGIFYVWLQNYNETTGDLNLLYSMTDAYMITYMDAE